jgi:pimeloyl-ACP methyl ester carboxylesterase
MTPNTMRPLLASAAITSLLLASCAAPISVRKAPARVPVSATSHTSHADALQHWKSGVAAKDPLEAAAHFLACARLAQPAALAGDPDALALHNHAIGMLVERLDESGQLPWGRPITLANGTTLRGNPDRGATTAGRQLVHAGGLEFKGAFAAVHAARDGVGAPLVAIYPEDPDFRKKLEPIQRHQALTAIVRFDSKNAATLELLDPLDVETVTLAGRRHTLAADFSAPVSMVMAKTRPDKLGLVRMLNPQKYSHTARVTRLQEYDPCRTPVLLVHGLDSTPATWTRMYHSLMQDPDIRRNYQFWVFSYPSGYPYPYSASLLRRDLDTAARLFPDSKGMVIVGHSMGGMISRLMVTDADDRIWKNMFGKTPAETQIIGHTRPLLEESLVFNHRDEIDTAIFIAAPHRGSELSNHFIGRTFARFIRLPTFITDTRNAFASVLTADAASLHLERAPSSIDTLSPNNRFVREVNKLPIAHGVTYHSIMGDRGKGDTADSSDGVVPYWSSHLDGAKSNRIVPSGHGAHEHPEGIEEVRRILKERLR